MAAERAAARQALTQQASSTEDGPRERAIRALADASELYSELRESHGLPYTQRLGDQAIDLYQQDDVLAAGYHTIDRLFWEENGQVLVAGANDPVLEARREAIRAIAFLAGDGEVASAIWSDEQGARARILACAGPSQDKTVRTRAIGALTRIVEQPGLAHTVWQHMPTRELVLTSAARPAGSEPPLAVRLEAWDCLIASVDKDRQQSGRSRLVRTLWADTEAFARELSGGAQVGDVVGGMGGDDADGDDVVADAGAGGAGAGAGAAAGSSGDTAGAAGSETAECVEGADVQRLVVACLGDSMEDEGVKLKALAFLQNVVRMGGKAAAELTWRQTEAAAKVLFCADPANTVASATHVRHAALVLLCKLLHTAGPASGVHPPELALRAMQLLLLAFEGPHAVLDAELRQKCELEYATLELAASTPAAGDAPPRPLRERARYAGLSLEERLARLRRVWQGAGEGKPSLKMKVKVGGIVESMLVIADKLEIEKMDMTRIKFDLDHGSDAGGLTRHCFAELGKGLLEVASVGASADALASIARLLKDWHAPLFSEPGQEARLIAQVRAVLDAQEESATAKTAAEASGSANGKAAAAPAAGAVEDEGPPKPKRQRTLSLPSKLFKVTERGSLAPSGAETLSRRVGGATDEAGAIVPEVNQPTLDRYRNLGRLCALALVNNMTLGVSFARYFLRLVMREPPTSLDELQAELQEEDPSFLGQQAFLTTPLEAQGMSGFMSFRKQNSMHLPVPLAKNASLEVTDTNKGTYLRRSLEHQLVRTIEAQASAFRRGVEDVTGAGWLGLLSPDELKALWGGQALDDERLAVWKAKTTVDEEATQVADLLWEWLGASTEAKRAQVLQFATGANRLPSGPQLDSWTFSIERLESFSTVLPTASNELKGPAMLARASTCSKTLHLPPYPDVEALGRGIEFSIMDGGFGNA